MDTKLRLPSREYILNAAADLAKRGAVLIVMRAESLWLEEPAVARHAKRYRVNNWRVASISAGNLPPKGWSDVRKAMAA